MVQFQAPHTEHLHLPLQYRKLQRWMRSMYHIIKIFILAIDQIRIHSFELFNHFLNGFQNSKITDITYHSQIMNIQKNAI